ncbi:MAG: DDE-type integrase/transposase/recombinase [Armatimonadetes bacterium]|nr:DDE-type integrase/transposase/recombinase [Armatimonadota bacterium]
MAQVAQNLGISQSSVYRHLKKLIADQSPENPRSHLSRHRAPRRDAGAVRFPKAVYDAFRELHLDADGKLIPPARWLSIRHISDILARRFPEVDPPTIRTLQRWRRLLYQSGETRRSPLFVEIESPNLQWQIDLSLADFYCIHPRQRRLFRPVLFVCIDACTRACLWAQYLTDSTAHTMAGCLYNAIYPQGPDWPMAGIPRSVRLDHGKQFKASLFLEALRRAAIKADFAPPHYPQGKARVERFIGTIHHNFEPLLPGFIGSDNTGDDFLGPDDFRYGARFLDPRTKQPLLSLADANDALRDWIVGSYHQRIHSALGVTPLDAWLSYPETRSLSLPDPDWLRARLLPVEVRRVRRAAVRLWGLFFADHERNSLADYEGCDVAVRYVPDDIRTVWVYDRRTDRLICQADLVRPIIISADDPSLGSWQALKRANRRRKQQIRETLRSVLDADIVPGDLLADLREAASRVSAVPPRVTYSRPTKPELEGVEIFGIPLSDAANE